MIVVGIDPGLGGGIAVIGLAGAVGRPEESVAVRSMPVTAHFSGRGNEVDPRGVEAFIAAQLLPGERVGLVAIERVGNMAREEKGGEGKRVKMGATSMFNFGDGFGLLRAAVILGGWPVDYPLPKAWQKRVLPTRARASDPKKAALSFILRRYPAVSLLATVRSKVPHKGIVDALCIAEYARYSVGLSLE